MQVSSLRTKLFGILVVAALSLTLVLLAACGGDDPTAPAGSSTAPTIAPRVEATTPPEPDAELSGTVAIAGSSTVFPISEAIAEEFSKANSGVRVNVASTGTGAGFRAICAGETQVSNASRPVKQSEIDTCAENDIELIEIPVAFDALSVVINPENDWAGCLTVDDLETIFGPEADGVINNWSQVKAGFPDVRMRLYGPSTASGTFDYFTEAIMDEGGAHRGDMDLATEDDPLIAQGVNGTQGGIGYFGLAYLAQYSELVTAVAVENPATGECVAPSTESVEAGSYQPLARPIFIYVNSGLLDERPELEAFVAYYLAEATKLVPEVGYVALPQEAYAWAQGWVDARTTGSVFKDVAPGTPLGEVLGRLETSSAPAATPEPEEHEVELSGNVAIAGSSTVFPISEAMAEEFSKANSGVRVNVASTGTGAGFRAVCAGETQVSNASRPVKQSEIDTCAENGIELIEIPVAFDALSVVVNPDNNWAGCLTVGDLEAIFGPEADGVINNWSQVKAGFPDVRMRLYGPSTASGTFDYFTEAIMDEGGAHRGDMDLATEDDPLIAQGVNGTQGGIGYFGLAYLAQYSDLVSAVAVENPATGECVAPSTESVEAGSYQPLARPIFIYVNSGQLDERPELEAFVGFYLEEATTLVPEVGYVALPQEAYTWSQGRVDSRATGSVFKDVAPGTPLGDVLGRLQ